MTGELRGAPPASRPRISFSIPYNCPDALDRLGCNRRVVCFLQIVKLAPYVRPAGGFLHIAALIYLVEAGERVGLQRAAKLAQMLLWMFSAAIRRVSKPHCRSFRCCPPGDHREHRSTAAPSSSCLARSQHRDRSVVAMHLAWRRVHSGATQQPRVPAGCWPRPPKLPTSSDPDRRLRVHRSPLGGSRA